jgi:hypothetical protein
MNLSDHESRMFTSIFFRGEGEVLSGGKGWGSATAEENSEAGFLVKDLDLKAGGQRSCISIVGVGRLHPPVL